MCHFQASHGKLQSRRGAYARVLAIQGELALVDAVQVPQNSIVWQHLNLQRVGCAVWALAVVQLAHVYSGIAGNRTNRLCMASDAKPL